MTAPGSRPRDRRTEHGIAIVGMACRYPDARSPGELWRNVLAQRRAFRRLPAERLRLDDYLDTTGAGGDTIYSPYAAVIEGYEFDRARFRVTGPAYRAADLTHWLALDVAADALADAGFGAGEGLPRATTGVVVGNTLTGEFSRANTLRLRWPYVRRVTDAALRDQGWPADRRREFLRDLESSFKAPFPEVTEETLAGGLSNTIAGRICNHFDLKGGGYTVDGACAASLLAVATACTSLTGGDLDVAVAGGVDLSLDPFELVGFSRTQALAPELMRVYDARSAGFWPGEGCGFVVLMREADAQARGLRVYATVRGWGVASDGSGGITRPEAEGQLLALRRAYARAGYGADTVAYFEGHGTGTAVGDAVELEVLSRARREAAPDASGAAVGSIKANIGHTKAAAGVAGLLKATLALHHRIRPPTTGSFDPHPALEGAAVHTLRDAEPWPAGQPLRASVSAMGFGGIDTHLTLEAAEDGRRSELTDEERSHTATPQDAELFLFGAGTSEALRSTIERVRGYAERVSFAELSDLAAALCAALAPGPHCRAAVVAATPDELERRLDELLAAAAGNRCDVDHGVFAGRGAQEPRIGFLFPGQGSPAHVGGGLWSRRFRFVRDLYREARLETYGDPRSTAAAQPAILTASLAGLAALDQLGLAARTALGHSLGELAAWHWAGALDGPALLRLGVVRGRAMADLTGPQGAMASLATDRDGAAALIADTGVVIAGLNHPRQTVVSGESRAVGEVLARARAAGIAAVRLPVSHAFHSPLVAGTAVALDAHVGAEPFRPLARAMISTITGGAIGPGTDLRSLLNRQLTSPVRFSEALAATRDVDLWIEAGPGQTLSGLAAGQTDVPVVALDAGGPSIAGWLRAAGAAWVMGAPVRLDALFNGRYVKPFELDWRPRFFANPCESAPVEDGSGAVGSPRADGKSEPGAVTAAPAEAAAPAVSAGTGSRSALEVVREMVAQRVELPAASIADDHRLLGDLHLNSIVVGQLALEASRQLGLPAPVDPTAYAGATVAELAQALDELTATRGEAGEDTKTTAPPGVDAWVRPFTVRWVERPAPEPARAGVAGGWQVVAETGDALAADLERELNSGQRGAGVALCLPPDPGPGQIELMIRAVRTLWPQRAGATFVVAQRGGGGGGFARSLHLESPATRVVVVSVPAGDPRGAGWIAAEAHAAQGFREVRYDAAGLRSEPLLSPLPLESDDPLPLGPADVVLVTGGGKGIAAECALALARERGVRLGLIGRAQPADDPVLAANLARLGAHGIVFHYASADVCDAAVLRAAVGEIEQELGAVTAVLHGAGENRPRPLSALEADDFHRTAAPKLRGAEHLASALDVSRLRLFVAFGSIIAETGLRGEADYAAANEWLAAWMRKFQAAHPHCRCRMPEWSVWSGVGMGERLGRQDALARDGIAAIPPDVGVRVLSRLIDARLSDPVVVVSGRFGAPPTVTLEERALPLRRFLERPRVHYPGVELIADAELSIATDPYLDDHVFHGERLLPAVMGIEAMRQAAGALLGDDGPMTFEDVAFAHPVVVPREGTETVRVAALAREDGTVDVVLRSAATRFHMDHFRARIRPASTPRALWFEGEAKTDGRLSLEPERDLYGTILFQSGRFQRLSGYRWLRPTECEAEIAAADGRSWFGPYLPDALMLGDPGARDAAIHAIQACIPHRVLLPVAVERIDCGALPASQALVVRARERSRTGDTFVYDLIIGEHQGPVLERWTGLTLQAVAGSRLPELWSETVLATYLERRLAELLPASPHRVAAVPGSREDGAARALEAVARGAHVVKRPDGKPEFAASAGGTISAAHAAGVFLAMAGRSGVLAADVEAVAERADDTWRGLLGAERWALAGTVADAAGEAPAAARTRMWSALECLKKAGAPLDTPLRLKAISEDGWVLLDAGSGILATWVGGLRCSGCKAAIAMLSGTHDASV